jgi:hypothetical protein
MTMTLDDAWARQIAWCDNNGSPFTARVLEAAWADRARGGALRELLPDWPGDAGADAVPLRVAGALHAMALDGSDATLAALYPPRADAWDAQRGQAAVSHALSAQSERVADYLRVAPQTNEIGRSAALLLGFAVIAAQTGLPLSTLEIGASAGLNQLWPHFRYELGDLRWGNATSPVTIRAEWRGAPPPALPACIEVAEQQACDIAPIDLRADGAALRLLSYVWADQSERLSRLRAALALAQQRGVLVDRSDAFGWVQRVLATPRPGRATVLYHSVMWQYMPQASRDALRACIDAAGARATDEAPFAWLAFEPPSADAQMQLRLTLWPGGEPRVFAQAHPHGRWIEHIRSG